MQLNTLFKASAVAMAVALAGCGGDININTSTEAPAPAPAPAPSPTPTPTPAEPLPGEFSAALSQAATDALDQNVIVQVLSGRITEDTTLVSTSDSDRVMYALEGQVFVGGDNTDSATLTIEPGTVVFGSTGGDVLVVSRGSQVDAEGSADAPIVMTSLQDITGEETGAGQWGGFVILGNAPSNKCPSDGSDCSLQVEGIEAGAVFGGTDEDDNSGTLRYLVLKNAGFEIAPDNELNGITFGGVGRGTTVEYIQVDSNADDGIEMFGGTVDFKNVVLTGIQDDSVDCDNGWRGRMQFVYVEHDKNGGDANRGIECDNDGSNPGKEPMTQPIIANMTIIGNNFSGTNSSEGVYLREGVGMNIYNMVITGPSEMGECLEAESEPVTQANLGNGNISMQNSAMACTNDENFKFGATDVNLEDWFLGQDGNFISSSVMLDSDGVPMAGSPLLGAGQDVANTVDGSFFESVDFIGAVGDDDWRQGWAFGFGGGEVAKEGDSEAPVAGCPIGTEAISPVDGSTTTCQLSGRITADMTLTEGNMYALSGQVFVGGDNVDSATLTIEPGVTLYGREGADVLVVSRGSQIMAEGTADKPITMTSRQNVLGEDAFAGQWGGFVILGNAPSNKCPSDGSDCALQVEGIEAGAVFGGTDSTDNSGTLRYVRVMNAGFEIAPDNELNGITFGGVGSGTTVEYLQVHQNADDGIEMFGGNVNFKYVALTSIQDDSVDCDNGWDGKMQYVLVKHADDDSDANRGIECDNDGSNPGKEPMTSPTIANMTIIGNNFAGTNASEGIYFREGAAPKMHNFIVTGPAGMGECLEFESEPVTQANLSDGTVMTHSVMACENEENFKFGGSDVNLEDWFLAQDGNQVAAGRSAVLNGIYTIIDSTTEDFSGDTFFDNVDFIGAVEEGNDWTAGWTVGLE
ncbi:hypothetical protein [Lacimicrobium alkaliphilum]|uniref:hypothetical protein n=1 Tax=Lacimicrobium alkaliphilum TaxID=1526571 RepID=UPI000BFF0F50|nr:hypothetical protein [Lacimicrobium alkaliphilum]